MVAWVAVATVMRLSGKHMVAVTTYPSSWEVEAVLLLQRSSLHHFVVTCQSENIKFISIVGHDNNDHPAQVSIVQI